MYTLKSFLLIFLFSIVIVMSGCAALLDGSEATYDENGKRDNGVSPNISGYLKEQVLLQVIKNMKEGSGDGSFPTISEYHPGWLNGVIENRSSQKKLLNVLLYDNEKKEFYLGPVTVQPKSYKIIWLPPGEGYYAEADNGKFTTTFNVLNNNKAEYPTLSGDITCYFYIYKE